MKTITIKDIAKKCGVGVSTVSRAINNHPDISEETRNMIMEVIKESNFVPNKSARNLKLLDTKTIAVLIKGIDNPFFQNMIKVFEEEIQSRKYSFILHRVDTNQDEVEVALELIKEKRLKGIVFLGGNFARQGDKLKEIEVPFILSTIAMSDNVDKNLYSSVCVDDRKESEKAVKFLCDKGHKKIAVLAAGKSDQSISKLRIEGYRNALKSKGIDINEKLITAVYSISDSMAIGACKAILDSGKRIPQDYSVVGFDGLDITYYYNPSITTIRQPVEAMARETTKILFDLINNKATNQHKVFEAELVERESTLKLSK